MSVAVAIDTLEAHELANLIPDMTEEERSALTEDIGRNGLLTPIMLYEGRILDGRHRYRSCLELVERGHPNYLRFDSFAGTLREAYSYVISMNVTRRHLEVQQRGALAADFAEKLTCIEGPPKGRPKKECTRAPISTDAAQTAADLFHVSRRFVYECKDIKEKAPDLFERLKDKGETVGNAQKELKQRERRERADRLQEAGEMPSGKFRVIYADPPWQYGNTMPDYFTEQADHYPLMSLSEICTLPVSEIAEEDAVLFLWVTSPILEDAFKVIHAWGFEYKSSFVWHKLKHNMGHYNSVRHEFLLICTRGSCQPDVQRLFPSVIEEERTEHSVKPETFREIIDTIYPHGERVELFARKQVEGWSSYGNELSRLQGH